MRKHLAIPALTLLLGLSAQATTWSPSMYRCSFDWVNQDQARGRQYWAKKWAQINPYAYPSTRDSRFWSPIFTMDANEAYEVYGIYIYPVYTDPVDFSIFLGPGAKGTWNASYTGDQLSALSYIYKPAPILNDGVCEPGASFSAREAVTLHLKSGGQMRVSPVHPLVNQEGWMIRAAALSAGDSLMRTDGSLDEVLFTEPGQEGEPQARLDGYLEGSDTFQSEQVEELNRLILRGNVPDAFILGR
jgi:hypothetical protein